MEVDGNVGQVAPEVARWANQALALDPNCAEAWYQLMAVEFSGHRQASARKALEYALRVVRLDPQSAAFTRGLETGVSIDLPPPFDHLTDDARYAELSKNPRFQKVVQRARVQFDETVDVLQQARSKGELPEYLAPALSEVLRRYPRR